MDGSSGFGSLNRARIALAFFSVVPLIAVLFLGFGRDSPTVVVLVTSIAIIAAGYCLAWGTESLQFMISQALALALLAVVQVMPEYSIEAVLSYNGAFDLTMLHYATASMTGANRLLLGLGWPSVVIISYLVGRMRGELNPGAVALDVNQSSSVFFLALSTIYSFVIVAKGTLSVIDAAILVSIYGSYVYVSSRLPTLNDDALRYSGGPARAISRLPAMAKYAAIAALLAIGGFVIIAGSGPFVESVLALGRGLGLNDYLLIQWLAPFLTELPEGITAAYWAAKSRLAPLAIANLVSSKVNQWTLLLGTIPTVYALALASFQPIQLTSLQTEEILITAAQSLYGSVCLLDLKLEIREAALLLGLFLVQFFMPPLRVEITVVYFVLTAVEVWRTRKNMSAVAHIRSMLGR